jgi:hypothetical protein
MLPAFCPTWNQLQKAFGAALPTELGIAPETLCRENEPLSDQHKPDAERRAT